MPVFIEKLEFVPENVAAGTFLDYLKGNIFQKITCTIEFRSEAWVKPTTDDPIQFQDPLQKTQDWVLDPTQQRFVNFAVGDKIVVTGTASNNATFIISEKVDDSLIRLVDSLGAPVTLTQTSETAGQIDLMQDPLGVVFKYGLIENAEAFNVISKVDGSEMAYERGVTSGPLTNGPMSGVGKKDWQIGSVDIMNTTTGGQRDAYTYKYKITQELFIHPFYLDTQLLELLNQFPISPRYFNRANCLKHVFEIQARRSLQDPNVRQEIQFETKDGQTGWFDEEYNGGTAAFSLGTKSWNNSINTIDPNKDTTITFEIKNDTAVVGDPTYVTVNFILLPEEANDYQNRNQLMFENYLFDRAQVDPGTTLANGENFGTGYQVLKGVTYASGSSSAVITATFDFGADALTKIAASTDKRFLIAAYANFGNIQTADTANYTTVLVHVGEMGVEITDGILDITNNIIYHDQNDTSTTVTTPKVKVEDEITYDSTILLDWNDFPNSQIDKIRGQIVAKKTGDPDVTLLSQEFDIQGNKLIGPVRDAQENPTTGFNVNIAEVRNNFRLYRNPTQDTTSPDKYAYRLQYPFLWRWEYWEQLILPLLPADWFDSGQQFNGYNNNWWRLSQLTGWDLYYRVQGEVSYQNTTQVVNNDTLITPLNYKDNVEWESEAVRTYDVNTQVTESGNPFIIANKNTRVEASIDYLGADSIDETDVYVVVRLIPKEGGTYIANETLSSVWNRTFGGGLFIGDSNGLVVVSENAGTFQADFSIDFNSLAIGVGEYTLSVSFNRNSAASMTDFGYVWTQDLKVLPILEDPIEIPKDDNPFVKCCYDLKVFADLSSDDGLKNDFSAPLKAFPLQYTVVMKLEKFEGGAWVTKATLNDNTYGQYFPLGFEVRDNKNYIGYKIDWKEVLNTGSNGFGAGRYRVKFEATGINQYSDEWCLDQYSNFRADKTVRVTYKWDRVIGDKDQKETRNFVGLNWNNQIRLNQAIFQGTGGDFEEDNVRYENGELNTVSKAFNEKYRLELREVPKELLSTLKYDILMADDITITDYNSENLEDLANIVVEIDGGISPNTSDNRPTADLEINFKSKFDNNRSFYS